MIQFDENLFFFPDGLVKNHQLYSRFFHLVGGVKDFLFSPIFGEDSNFDYFSKGLKPPSSHGFCER